jgi:hypothetical protein
MAAKRSPPYSKTLRPNPAATCWICTGSGAWDRAASETWHPRAKVCLPPDSDPGAYRWGCVAGFADVAILADGTPPPLSTLQALAAELMVHVDHVLYLDPSRQAVVFQPSRRAA